MDKKTTFSGGDSVPNGNYIIRVGVEVREKGKQYVCLRPEGGDFYLVLLDSFLDMGGVLEREVAE